jgi:adenylate cyclase
MHANSIAGWLLADAWKIGSEEGLMSEFCRCLQRAGVPVSRMTIITPALHPQVFATVLVWREDAGAKTIHEPHDILSTPRFTDSPFALILRGAGGVRRRIERSETKLDFPVVRDLKKEGATDYVAMPFRFSDGQINVVSMTSFARGGFSASHLGSVYEIIPALGRLFEVHAQKRISVSLLETYLGKSTGKRVLEGQIKHGDGQLIHAVIWFCDLRDSTNLAGSMDTATYLAHLNRFFAAMAGSIIEHGGEILAYIGDAVLAIFPIADGDVPSASCMSPANACAEAIAAARLAAERIAAANAARPDMPALQYGIGLHVGDVTYGNIGIPQRLQFTVIGSAANEASRIESMTKELDEPVLVSSRFAEHYPGELDSRGSHVLKGVTGVHELFALAPVGAG